MKNKHIFKLFILSVFISLPDISFAQTVVIDTVSTASNYSNQVWYSLLNGEVKSESKDNWDLAFEITGFNSSILANTQKTGLKIFQSPYSANDWNSFDTSNYTTWTPLHNSDTMWEIGALNRSGEYDTEDMGWGTYDMNSHAIVGTRLFLVQTTNNVFYKLIIKNLISGTYKFTYMNIDDNDSNTFELKKSDYSDKHFAYFDFNTKTFLDREPSLLDWDITFTKFIYNNYPLGNGSFLDYPVTGILQNKGIKVAEVRNINKSTFTDYKSQVFSSNINVIGSDWKSFTGSQYAITDSLVYFVKDKGNNIWKLIMTGFIGSSNGNYLLTKQKIGNTEILSVEKNLNYKIYPNPGSSNEELQLLLDFNQNVENFNLQITDISGKTIQSFDSKNINGMSVINILPIEEKGIYFIAINADGIVKTSKIIVQ